MRARVVAQVKIAAQPVDEMGVLRLDRGEKLPGRHGPPGTERANEGFEGPDGELSGIALAEDGLKRRFQHEGTVGGRYTAPLVIDELRLAALRGDRLSFSPAFISVIHALIMITRR